MAQDCVVAVDGQALRCRIDGPEGAPWLVFSNSLMTDLRLWDEQVERFAGRFRILRYDQRGHGRSAVPSDDCDFDRLVEDLAGLLAHFDIADASVVGVSMGGITALGLASRHPDRVGRVVICDCGPASNPAGAEAWEERIALARAGGMDALVEPTVGRWFRPDSLKGHTPGPTLVREMIRATPCDGFIRAARALQNYDFTSDLAAVCCPTAFVVGESDANLPFVMRKMADLCPSAEFTSIAGSGHLPNVEQPDRFDGAISKFLIAAVSEH